MWSADHETGDLSQWSEGKGGGEYNSGVADSRVSQERAHSGDWSVKMTITTTNSATSGTRLFRWKESHRESRLHYGAWFYFPQPYTVRNWWNIFQWKSKRDSLHIDPFFILNVGTRSNGAMYLYLFDWQHQVTFPQHALDLPVGQWVHIEAEYACAPAMGAVKFWQDGTLLYDIANVKTRYPDGDCQWSVDNYSDAVVPNPATIYVDDAAITEP